MIFLWCTIWTQRFWDEKSGHIDVFGGIQSGNFDTLVGTQFGNQPECFSGRQRSHRLRKSDFCSKFGLFRKKLRKCSEFQTHWIIGLEIKFYLVFRDGATLETPVSVCASIGLYLWRWHLCYSASSACICAFLYLNHFCSLKIEDLRPIFWRMQITVKLA